jgi:hypothetical protein
VDRGSASAWRLEGRLRTPHPQKPTYYEMLHNLMDVCKHGNEISAPINGVELLLGIAE